MSTIEDEEEASALINAALHPNQGGRRGLGLVRQNLWGEKPLISEKPIIIPQIETITGIRNLSKIKRSSFSFYLIGPYDLSASLGTPGEFDGKEFLKTFGRRNPF